MKQAETLSRHKARENAFLALFSLSFIEDPDEVLAQCAAPDAEHPLDEYGRRLFQGYTAHAAEIDKTIDGNLKNWRAERLARVDLALLRLAIAEMRYGDDDIESIAINEAVELAKKYGEDESYQFVNGVLGSVARAAKVGE